MNPVEIGQGTSFKGLAAYLLNDAGRDRFSDRSETRVGWSESHNLAGADADQAWRLMASTAKSADALKEAAGIKKGRPTKNTVYHYTITFPPGEQPGEAIERKAVTSSLAALGLEDHQALAVRHIDTDHAHVHVMVNLIDPNTGMSAATPQMQENGRKASKLSNSRRKLSSWAARFERENGLTVTQGRAKNAERRAKGEKVQAARTPRNVHERQHENQDRRRDFVRRTFEDQAREIQARSAAQKAIQRDEWDALRKGYADRKDALRARQKALRAVRAVEVKAGFGDRWRGMRDRHDQERRAFYHADRSAIGAIWHGAATFRELAKDGRALGGFVAAFNRTERMNTLRRKQDRERDRLGREVKAAVASEMKAIRAAFDLEWRDNRDRFLAQCRETKTSHDQAWRSIREAWRTLKERRTAALGRRKTRTAQVQRAQQMGRGRELKPGGWG